MGQPLVSALDRILSRVQRIPECGCWIWEGNCYTKRGYGDKPLQPYLNPNPEATNGIERRTMSPPVGDKSWFSQGRK